MNAGGHLKQIASEYSMVSMPLGADGRIQFVTDTLQVRSHFGSSAAPSLSGQCGACEPIAEDVLKRIPAVTPPLRPIVLSALALQFVLISLLCIKSSV